jgi:hypothetical protein
MIIATFRIAAKAIADRFANKKHAPLDKRGGKPKYIIPGTTRPNKTKLAHYIIIKQNRHFSQAVYCATSRLLKALRLQIRYDIR